MGPDELLIVVASPASDGKGMLLDFSLAPAPVVAEPVP